MQRLDTSADPSQEVEASAWTTGSRKRKATESRVRLREGTQQLISTRTLSTLAHSCLHLHIHHTLCMHIHSYMCMYSYSFMYVCM